MPKSTSPPSHYMQSAEWAGLRPAAGWRVDELQIAGKPVYTYTKPSPLGGLVYVPGYLPETVTELTQLRDKVRTGNLSCKLEACVPLDQEICGMLERQGWRPAKSIQYSHTVRLKLDQSEDDLWMSMKARARQEINYARRDGVTIEFVKPNKANLTKMYDLLQETSQRQAFGIRERPAMMKFWQAFAAADKLHLAWAWHQGQTIAGAVFITNGTNKAWYKDAGSRPEYAKLFAPRLLLWEAARRFRAEHYAVLDLSGIPSPEEYESSPMKGIYIFKTAFSRQITTMMPAYEYPLRPRLYPLWRTLEPIAIKARRSLSTVAGNLRGSRS